MSLRDFNGTEGEAPIWSKSNTMCFRLSKTGNIALTSFLLRRHLTFWIKQWFTNDDTSESCNGLYSSVVRLISGFIIISLSLKEFASFSNILLYCIPDEAIWILSTFANVWWVIYLRKSLWSYVSLIMLALNAGWYDWMSSAHVTRYSSSVGPSILIILFLENPLSGMY